MAVLDPTQHIISPISNTPILNDGKEPSAVSTIRQEDSHMQHKGINATATGKFYSGRKPAKGSSAISVAVPDDGTLPSQTSRSKFSHYHG